MRIATTFGYVMVETVVAMGLLSVSMIAIHGSIRQTVIARGQAQDYTIARFLLEEVVAEKELLPEVIEGRGGGRFPAPCSRFRHEWEITRVTLPRPPIPPGFPPERYQELERRFMKYIGKLQVRITWTRAGQDFEVVGETLLRPGQLWTPPED